MSTEPHTSLEGIAIVGMAGRFPGAPDIESFWKVLTEGRETITDFDRTALPAEERAYEPDYVPRRGVVDRPEWFDAAFFNIAPREAETMDPQQRIFMETCWHALENAGCDPQQFPGSIGVFAGMSNNSWLQHRILHNKELRAQVGYENAMICNEKDYLATRTAYKLNLRGPALNIYTACSTSLVAVCQAVQALQSFQCDAALAGGVSVKWPQERGFTAQEGSIYSPDGHCRPYDAAATGTVFSNGIGVVLLKRLEDAVRDRDLIWAVIKGAALNNDGADKASFTAPSVDGHTDVIALAQALAGFEPDTIGYIEGHGTATPIGDPIEVAGLTKAFRRGTARTGFCGLGSLKSNMGHMDAASGVAGLIKATLALYHQQLPPTLHFRAPNPALQLETTPFFVVAKLQDWPAHEHPRRAGVSSFGVGGTNAHVVLEECGAAVSAASVSATETIAPQILTLSAKTATALAAACENLAGWLETHPVPLADAAWTLQTGRRGFPYRRAIVTSSTKEAVKLLREKSVVASKVERPGLPAVFVFPGQGAQHLRMGAETYAAEQVFREAFDRCADLFQPLLGYDLRHFLHPDGDEEVLRTQLNETRFTQPALFAVEYALAEWLKSRGLKPSGLIGHSIGEYVAATLAGVFPLEDATKIIAARGRVMFAQERGSMLAVRLSEAEVLARLPAALDIATINGPAITVVAGAAEAISAFAAALEADGVSARVLLTSHAFHSRMMDAALGEFRDAWNGITLHKPEALWISNVTGREISADEAMSPEYWVRHVRSAVRFADGIATLAAGGPCVFIECGPSTSLAPLIRQHPAAKECECVSLFPPSKDEGADEFRSLLVGIGRLWAAGAAVEWSGLHGAPRCRVPLPGYPFERQRFCPDAALPAGTLRDGEGWLLYPTAAVGSSPQPACGLEVHAAVDSAVDTSASSDSRKDHLIHEVRALLHRTSGIDISNADPAALFLDLGFDSLFLTQASLALKKHFGVKITFRQLMEQQSSITALAGWLDGKLPAGSHMPPAPAAPRPAAAAASVPALSGSVEDRLVRIEAVLATLTGSAPQGTNEAGESHAPHSPFSVRVSQQTGSEGGKIAFGPFRPMEKTPPGSLTPQQQAHLDELITDYVARYPKSRQFTADHREVFADPRAVGGFNPLWKDMVFPAVTDRSEGAYLYDIDGHQWVDVVHGFGSGFFGHKPAFVVEAIKEQLERGYEIGPTCPIAGEVANMICEFSGKDRVAFCNTGSEALMAAIRVSRTISGRDRIVMFAGAYHGIFDEVLARPLVSNGELRTIPIAPGIPESAHANILVLEYGHPESLEIIKRHAHEIAAVLVEPVPSRRPDIAPVEFVQELRRITAEAGTALVFDEVVLGFRTHPLGAQHLFGISADLVSYGKVIGGGMPLGVLAGTRRYMDALDGGHWQYGDGSAPEVGVTFFAGTFIRHPLTMAAARAVLLKLKAEGPTLQTDNDAKAARFVEKLSAILSESGVPVQVTRYSSLWMLHPEPSLRHFSLLFYHLRLRGIHIWEGRGNFVSLAHTEADLDRVLTAFRESIAALQEGAFMPRGGSLQPAPGTAVDAAETTTFRRVPTTPAQREMFLQSQLNVEASLACHESVVVKFAGIVDAAIVERVLYEFAARHDALRASFSTDGLTMFIAAKPAWPLRVVKTSDVAALAREDFLKPFDLGDGPLLRATLAFITPVNGGGQKAELILTAHHLVCDGWSFGVLMHELPSLYRRACGANEPVLPPAAGYADYVTERQQLRDAGEFEDAEKYWQEQFVTVPAPLELPCVAPRKTATGLAASTLDANFPPALGEKLRSFCRDHKVTPFVTLLASWNALLSRLSRSNDMVIGTPMANQPASGRPDLVGHAVQFLPLRLRTAPGATCAEHLDAVRNVFLSAQENQDCTLGELLDRLPHLPAGERKEFVRTTFTLEPAAPPLDLTPELKATIQAAPKRRLFFELSNFIFVDGDRFRVAVAWQDSLFDRETIARWVSSWFVLLESFLGGPGRALSSLPLLDLGDRRIVVEQFNESSRPPFPQRCIHELFEEVVSSRGASVALVQGAREVTYQELNACANRLAWRLRSSGVGADTPVAVLAEKSFELVAGLLAILKAGGAYVPIDVQYPPARIREILADSGAMLVLTDEAAQGAIPAEIPAIRLDDPGHPASEPADNLPCLTTPGSLAYIIYTSGSTGVPKGSPVPHRGVVRLVKNQNFAVMDEQQTFLLSSAISFDASTLELWGPLLNGGKLALLPAGSFSLEAVAGAIRRHQVTTLWLTSGLFSLMVDERLDDLRPLRQLLTGGDVVSAAHAGRVLKEIPHLRLINGYGPTENTTFTCCHTITPADCDRGVLPIGRPIAHTRCYVVDAAGHPVPVGVTGELLTGGAGLARGYWNRPELTGEKFIPDHISGEPGARLYRTGDLCRWRADGTIEFTGRADSQLKIRGFRIEPAEVEQVLLRHPSVQRCCVVAHGTEASSKRLIAYVVTASGRPVEVEPIRDFLRPLLPGYMAPSFIIAVPELPITPNGKVDIRALPGPDSVASNTGEGGRPGGAPPSTAVEKRLAAIWQEVLEFAPRGLDADFFELGGTSLQGLRLFTRIRQEFSISLPLTTLYDASTLGAMARRLSHSIEPAELSGMPPDDAAGAEESRVITAERGAGSATVPGGEWSRAGSGEVNGRRRADAGRQQAMEPALFSGGPGEPLRRPSPIACIQREGNGTPLFLLHGGDGGALFYRNLLPGLGRNHPVWVIESPGISDDDWILSSHSIESCAAEYLRLIRSVYPSGQVIIGGYSYGGVVAYEMCHLLREQSTPPELLILFDTENPANGPRELSLAERIAAGWRLGGKGMGSKIRHLTSRFTEGLRSKSNHSASTASVRALLKEGRVAESSELRTAQIRQTCIDALNAYEPSLYDGPVLLFRSNAVSDKYERTEDYNWRAVIPGLRIVRVTGDHLVLFEEPWVRGLAEELRMELAALGSPLLLT